MNILVTGRGGAGSWAVRGEQLGHAAGARVKPMATLADCRAADVIVAVKRVPFELLQTIRRSGRPWVYDIVDAYPQPDSAAWTRKQAVQWLTQQLALLRPDLVIWPNARMQADAELDGVVIYHHHRPGIARNPLRPQVATVAYEGATAYLEGWIEALSDECKKRGLAFFVNPPRLADADVVVALRGGRWAGYASHHWKSNVKLANAHGSGTPFIGTRECGYTETAAGGEIWVEQPGDLALAFDQVASFEARFEAAAQFSTKAFTVDAAAAQLKEALCALKC